MLLDDISSMNNSEETSNNQRQDDRRHLIYYLKVENRVTHEVIGRVVDITANGLLLISNDKFDEKSKIPVRIELGDELFQKMHQHLELDIECRWSKKDINPSYYVNGFSFINNNDESDLIIRKLVEILGFRE